MTPTSSPEGMRQDPSLPSPFPPLVPGHHRWQESGQRRAQGSSCMRTAPQQTGAQAPRRPPGQPPALLGLPTQTRRETQKCNHPLADSSGVPEDPHVLVLTLPPRSCLLPTQPSGDGGCASSTEVPPQAARQLGPQRSCLRAA